jgi:hypothetical protein
MELECFAFNHWLHENRHKKKVRLGRLAQMELTKIRASFGVRTGTAQEHFLPIDEVRFQQSCGDEI